MPSLGLSALPAPAAAPAAVDMRPISLGGFVNVQSATQVLAQQTADARARASTQAQQPVVQNLAHYVRECWSKAKQAKMPVERRMLRAVRARRGEYDPEKLAQIREQGGSEIYMMLFSTKARQAGALMRDVLIGAGTEKPWTLRPTAEPDLDPATVQQIMESVYSIVQEAEMSGLPLDMEAIRQMLRDAKASAESKVMDEARLKVSRMERKMEDQMQEGGFLEALDQFIDDLTMFPTAFLKGPVVRKRPRMAWVPAGDDYDLQVTDKLVPEWERVDPFNIYPAPWSRGVNDAWLIERHKLSKQDLEALIGVEGYSDDAIRAVIDEVGQGGLHEWLSIDSERQTAEGRNDNTATFTSDLIDAVQFWGPVTGKMLVDWGMPASSIKDPAKSYEAEVWLIGSHVIKAALNRDPVKRRPYFATGYERVPGCFWHNSLFSIVEDCQDMCNAAARALANNMGIASGPQVWINVDRMPPDAEISTLYPWKIHQTTSDPMGSTAAPMGFFQPSSNAPELMSVFEKFSQLADEVSGIPRYMTGTEGTPGAGRTASGLSMMIGNASKTIKNVVSNLDVNVIEPAIKFQYFWNMRYSEDRDLKGDVNIVARGALSLTTKEAAQVRRNEFLQATANPIDLQIVGMEGRAHLLREAAKSLDMDTDKIIPPESVLKARQALMQQAQMQQQAVAQQQEAAQGNGQELANGAPVTDNFQPA